MTSKAWIVYRHTSPSGKVYIGITSDLPKRRWGNGIHKYASNPYFIKAIQKHGWENFTHEILHEGLSHDEACTYEKELIAFYKRGGICYNITDGGEGTLGVHKPRHSKEWKQTLSEQMSGKNNYFYDKHFIGELHPMWGKHHSDKTKALQSLRKNKIKKRKFCNILLIYSLFENMNLSELQNERLRFLISIFLIVVEKINLQKVQEVIFENFKIMNKNLENIINQLIDYYKEVNDLKESGIDISKLAAHKVLYNLYTQMLIDSVGLSRALAIQRYAEYPTCSIEDFNIYLNDQYPERKIVDRPDVKEFEEDAKEKFVRERIESGDYIRESGSGQVVNSVTGNIMESDILEKLSEATKDEKVVKDVCQKLPEYYINGKKIAKEAYDEAMLKVDKIIEKLFKIIDE